MMSKMKKIVNIIMKILANFNLKNKVYLISLMNT